MLGWAIPWVSTNTLRCRTFGKVRDRLRNSHGTGSLWRGVCSRHHSERMSSSNVPDMKREVRENPKVSILPIEVVQRIASGEVICGYESVVQELVENAIDAQASKVEVNIDVLNRSVSVQDNGIGISMSDGLLDVARCNATSKLFSLPQLENGINTLGFRGQGLWSVASTAKRLSISSCPKDGLYGTTVSFANDGQPLMQSISNLPMNAGTIVQAVGLPWHLNNIEKRRMVRNCKQWLIRTALCHPHVSFCFSRNGSLTWNNAVKPEESLQQTARCLAAQFECSVSEFRSASASIPKIGEVSLVIGLPSAIHSASRSWLVTAVNGRCVELNWIKSALCEAVPVPRNRYPVIFAHIQIDPQNVNWNISPKKTVMRFKTTDLKRSAKDACLALTREALRQRIASNDEETKPHGAVHKLHDLKNSSTVGRFLRRLQEQEEANREKFSDDSEYMAPFSAKVIGQVLNTYILVEYKGGILLVEQHVADERTIYETLLRLWDESRFEVPEQKTILPCEITEEQIFSLTSLGITLEPVCDTNGTTRGFRVMAVPSLLATFPSSELASALIKLGTETQTIQEAAASLSCQLAIKNGRTLNQTQMKKIAWELLKCDNPHTCPHGRPIFVDLGVQELAKLFGRSWFPERSADNPLKSLRSPPNWRSFVSSQTHRGVLEE